MNWPVKQYEYGTYPWFQQEIGNAMSLPPNPAELGHSDRSRLHSVITAGVQRFYHPQPGEFTIPDATEAQKERLRRAPYAWTFLTNVLTVNLVATVSEYELPDDFAGFLGDPTTARTTGRLSVVGNPDQIRQMIDSEGATGFPQYVSRQVVSGKGTSRSENRLLVYPIPTAGEAIKIQHSIAPPPFDDDHPYLLCGSEHIEAVRACCLAVLEERDGSGGTTFYNRMMERMAASIMRDQQAAAGTTDGIWPDEDVVVPGMNRAYFEKEIGRFLGYGPNSNAWSDANRKEIRETFRRAFHRFCNNALIPGDKYPHQWSFLKPTATLSLVAGQDTYDLPADFASFDGPLTYLPGQYRWFAPLQLYAEHQLRQLKQFENSATYPQYAAIRAKNYDDDAGTRYELVVWPPPDVAYTLQYRYRVNPEALVQ